MFVTQIFRADPVESKVGKRRLGTPAGRNVQIINQLLNGLFNLFIGQVVSADVRSEIGIDRRESLCAGPFILQGAHKVDHLADGSGKMFGRTGLGFARNTVEAFMQQVFQRPTGTVSSQHVQIVNMDIAVAMSFADLCRINMA